MSAAPNLPPYYDESRGPQRVPEPRRRALWKRILLWTGGLILALIILVVIAAVILLHSARFHGYVLRMAEQKAATSLGTNVQVRDFALTFHGISPTLDVYGIVVDGAAPYATPPLLTTDHARIGVQIVSLLSKKWYLSDVTIDHPVVHVFSDARGINDLPHSKSSNSSSGHTSVFDLGVRHALLDRGEIYYNNRRTPLYADLHALTLHSAFDPAKTEYAGSLSYADGHLRMGTYRPIPHSFAADFSATRQQFVLQNARLSSGRSYFLVNATVANYSQPNLQARYSALLDATEFRRILKNASLPSGIIRAAGDLGYRSQPGQPVLSLLTLNGDLSSPALLVANSSARARIANLGAHYSLANGNFELSNAHANLLGGELRMNATIDNLGGTQRSHLAASLRNVSLAQAKSALRSASARTMPLAGTLDGNADARWGKTMSDLVLHADAALNAALTPPEGSAPIPLSGALHAQYVNASKELALKDSFFHLPQTFLTLDGSISRRSALRFDLQSHNLHELETLAQGFRAPGSAPLDLYGTANLNGTLRGSMTAPQLQGGLTAANLRVHNTAWRVLHMNFSANAAQAQISNGELTSTKRGDVRFNLSTRLHHWKFTPESPFAAALNAANLQLAELAGAAGVQTPMKGDLSANVAMRGTETAPVGQGTIALTNAQISSEPVNRLQVNFNSNGTLLHTTMAARLPAGAANGRLDYTPRTKAYDFALNVPGIQLAKLRTVQQRGMDLNGVLSLIASGRGTTTDPQLNASLTIPKLAVHNQAINAIALNTTVADHVANFTLGSQMMNTSLRGSGTVNLTGNYFTQASIDTQRIPLGPIISAYAPSQAGKFNGVTELHATLRGPLKEKRLLEAHLQLPVLALNYNNAIDLAAAAPVRVDYADQVLTLQRTELRGTDTELQLQASVPMNSTQAPMHMLALGSVDLKLIQLVDPELASSGLVRLNVNSYGQRANPDVQGQIELVNVSVASGAAPLGLQNGNGLLTLTKNRLDITRFSGEVGGGNVTASGGVVYRPSLGFDLALAGHGIRVLLPQGIRTQLGTNLALSGTMQSALLNGQVRITQLSFTPDFELANLMNSVSGDTVPSPSQGFAGNVKLNIGVTATNGINLVSRTLSLDGNADLQVRGTAADPVITGRTVLTGGDLIFQGNRYVLQSGTIDFVNPYQTEPMVDVSLNTDIQQYNILMRFDGPVTQLHTSYTSVPSLPPADIIHLIAFGNTTEAAAANPTPSGSMGAESVVASQVSSQLTTRVAKAAGISQLSIDPELGGNQQNPGAVVAIQQRVTGNLFVTFGTDVTQTQNTTIKLEYKATPKVSFSGTRDQNGGFGFDTKIHKSW